MMCVRVRSLVAIDEDLCLPVCCLSTECVRVVVCAKDPLPISRHRVWSPCLLLLLSRNVVVVVVVVVFSFHFLHTHAHTRLDSTLTP